MSRRVKIEIPDSALDDAARTQIKALKAELAKAQRRLTKLEAEEREVTRLREGLRIIESAASELRAEGFAGWWD